MKDSITLFCLAYAVQIPSFKVDDFRPLPSGSYSHATIPFGSSRLGITNGIEAYVVFDLADSQKVVHCHLENLDMDLDPVEPKDMLSEPDSLKPSILEPRKFYNQHEFWLPENQALRLRAASQRTARRPSAPRISRVKGAKVVKKPFDPYEELI